MREKILPHAVPDSSVFCPWFHFPCYANLFRPFPLIFALPFLSSLVFKGFSFLSSPGRFRDYGVLGVEIHVRPARLGFKGGDAMVGVIFEVASVAIMCCFIAGVSVLLAFRPS